MKKLLTLAAGIFAAATPINAETGEKTNDADILREQASKARTIDATVNQTGTNVKAVSVPEFTGPTGPEGDPTKFCGKYSIEDVEALGMEAFIKAHPDIRQYATDHLNYDPEWDEESDLIVILKGHLKSVKLSAQIAKKEENIANSKENIANSKENIANSKENITEINNSIMNKLKEREKKNGSKE